MARLTTYSEDHTPLAPRDGMHLTPDGEWYTGPTVERLAAFEDVYDRLREEQTQLAARLDTLRQEGKEKSAKFRELLGRKLVNSAIIQMLEFQGL